MGLPSQKNIITLEQVHDAFTANIASTTRKQDEIQAAVTKAISQGVTFTSETLNLALKNWYTDPISSVVEAGAVANQYSYDLAVQTARIENIKAVKQAGGEATDQSLDFALKTRPAFAFSRETETKERTETNNRRLELVKHVIANGAKPSSNSVDLAIQTGDLDTLKAVVVAGGKASENDLDLALQSRKQVLSLWSLRNGREYEDTRLLKQSISQAKEIHRNMIQQVIDAGGQVSDDSLDLSIATGDPEIIKIVRDAGAKPSSNTREKIDEYDSVDTLFSQLTQYGTQEGKGYFTEFMNLLFRLQNLDILTAFIHELNRIQKENTVVATPYEPPVREVPIEEYMKKGPDVLKPKKKETPTTKEKMTQFFIDSKRDEIKDDSLGIKPLLAA